MKPVLSALVLVGLLLGCAGNEAPETYRSGSAPVADGNIRVGAFNMQNFGPTKAGQADIVSSYARLLLEYDAVLLQEIEDASGNAPDILLAEVNRQSAQPYDLVLSARLGRSSAKEQYALLYRRDRLSVLGQMQIEDPEDEFEREPIVFTIQHAGLTYGLMGLHAKPDDAVQEIDKAAFVYDSYRNATGIESLVLAGDLNADCSYATDEQLLATALCADRRFSWLIPDSADTTTGSTDCAYDRIVVRGPISQHLAAPAIYRFDEHLGISAGLSDHFPVEVEIGSSGGDYSGFVCAPQDGAPESPATLRTAGRYAYDAPSGGSGSGSTGGGSTCCRVCTTGKACGDSCISKDKTCHVGTGCACNGP